jgi:large subunit ribosomal protein L6
MSRVGNAFVRLPQGVEVTLNGAEVSVKGPKGELSETLDSQISIEHNKEEGYLALSRANESKDAKAKHGLSRALVQNMVVGVSEGYKKQLELVGVGFRATVSGQNLEMALGYSHNFLFQLPPEIKAVAETERGKAPVVTLESIDKQLLGQVVAKLRSLRKIEPYKGKGIRFVGEQIRRKAGKTAAK